MLTLTENATTVIKSITGADVAPSQAGVRISQQDPAGAALALNTADAPLPGDEVVEDRGARVFLDRGAAGAGLLIPRCRSVHTFGMRFSLDLVFLDLNLRPVARRYSVPPRRIAFERRAQAVLELPSAQRESS